MRELKRVSRSFKEAQAKEAAELNAARRSSNDHMGRPNTEGMQPFSILNPPWTAVRLYTLSKANLKTMIWVVY